MKFSLTKEEKIKVYNDVRVELQKNIIVRLNILGVDPDIFDEESFQPSENNSAEEALFNLIQKLKETEEKIKAIENE